MIAQEAYNGFRDVKIEMPKVIQNYKEQCRDRIHTKISVEDIKGVLPVQYGEILVAESDGKITLSRKSDKKGETQLSFSNLDELAREILRFIELYDKNPASGIVSYGFC